MRNRRDDDSPLTAASRRSSDASEPPSISSRLVPMAITFVGVLVVVLTQAVQRGLVTGVKVEWPAYLLGGVMIVLGIAGLGRRESGKTPPREDEPTRESGLEPSDVDELERMNETLRHIQRARRSQFPDHDH